MGPVGKIARTFGEGREGKGEKLERPSHLLVCAYGTGDEKGRGMRGRGKRKNRAIAPPFSTISPGLPSP